MAHVMKFGRSGVGAILAHCERSRDATLERENIDADRTQLNYTLGGGDFEAALRQRVESHNAHGRRIRSDAVVMADWVITAPRDLLQEGDPERLRMFFESAFAFLQDRYGAGNVPIAWVHMDETTPHMHAPVIPFDERTCRLQASKIISRKDLLGFHPALSDRIERDMGRRYAVELTDEEREERAARRVGGEEYKDARRGTERAVAEMEEAEARLESVRQAQEITYRDAFAAGREQEALRESQEKEGALEREVAALEREVAELESGVQRAAAEARGLRAGLERVRGLFESARGWVRALLASSPRRIDATGRSLPDTAIDAFAPSKGAMGQLFPQERAAPASLARPARQAQPPARRAKGR